MPSPSLHRRFRADQLAPTRARHLLRRWLTDLRWPADAADDFSVAVFEAAANVVTHAYPHDQPGWFELTAYPEPVEQHRFHLVTAIRDEGQWQPRTPNPSRRWGTPLMEGNTELCTVVPSAHGTLTLLVSQPASLPINVTAFDALTAAS